MRITRQARRSPGGHLDHDGLSEEPLHRITWVPRAGEGACAMVHRRDHGFLTALTEVTGDFHQAIKLSSEVLAIRGRIFPSTLVNVKLGVSEFRKGAMSI